MQGQLQEHPLAATIYTGCACCGQSMVIELDSQLNYTVQEQDAEPLVYVPLIDFNTLDDPSIIEAF